MTRILYSILFLSFLAGCSNEFEILEDPKEIPLIYGVIDPSEENQYIRVERVFSEDGVSALQLAQDPARLYYEDITVKLIKGNQEFTLEKVNGEDEGLPREDGAFAQVPNILYKIDTEVLDLERNDELSISVEGIFDDRAVTGEITIVGEPVFVPASELVFDPERTRKLSWTPRAGNEIYSIDLYLDITEVNTVSGEEPVNKRLHWPLASATTDDFLSVQGIEFYQWLGGELESQENVIRFLGNSQIEVTAGDINVADIVRVSGANLGITSSGEIPTFSNLSEGLGLFACKNKYTSPPLPVSGDTRLEITENEFTMDLGFQN